MLKFYLVLMTTLCIIVALLHAMRIQRQMSVVVGSFQVPLWASFIAVSVAIFLAMLGMSLF